MSIFGAMSTAITGLTSQSSAFSNIGNNLANTQTVGYKDVGTSFEEFVSGSSLSANGSSAVVARPDYQNSVQGSVTQTSDPLNLAISGQGFFAVSMQTGESNGQKTFSSQTYYTREGDYKLDSQGYLVNSTGHYLNGWVADSTGQLDETKTSVLRVGQSGYAPVATSRSTIAANLPATPTNNNPFTTDMPVYDSLGTPHNLELTWAPTTTANVWSLQVAQQGSTTPLGSVDVTFGSAGNSAAPSGTISAVTPTSAGVTGSTFTAGQHATAGLTADFGQGPQQITLDLGTFGGTDGVTQFAGSSYNLISMSQNGVPAGSFSGVSISQNGDVVVNYDNGSSRTVARVPLVTFSAADSLKREDGQAFLATKESGDPRVNEAGGNGSGNLVTSSVEQSNVDIASEFSKLIVAQRAYSANTKMVTTADDMLQQTIEMKR